MRKACMLGKCRRFVAIRGIRKLITPLKKSEKRPIYKNDTHTVTECQSPDSDNSQCSDNT